MFSLLSQVLGLDHDQEVLEMMLGFLMIYHEAEKSQGSITVAFDQLFSESMHGQFVNFQYISKFRYQTYLLKFLVEFNLSELQGKDPEMFANPDAFSEEAGVFSYFDFTNKVISRIYDIIHEERLPRVTKEMRSGLQLKKGKATGDWFLYHHSTVIRIYGF